ncbi:MAG TPA: leucyl aminopeptidase [Bacilli bacterium]|nr:leucyl aminopeptidase [Bacilli bacterium]
MNMQVHTQIALHEQAVDSLLVFHTEGQELPAAWQELDAKLGGELTALLQDEETTGKKANVVHIRSHGRIAAKHLFLCGLGAADKLGAEIVRQAAGTASRELKGKRVAVALFADEYAAATVEGILMGRYVHRNHKSEQEESKQFTDLLLLAQEDMTAAAVSARINAEAVNFARELTELPANLLDPLIFADKAQQVAAANGLDVEVLDEAQQKELGLNLLLAVGMGSDIPPRLVVLRYNGAPDSEEVLGLVGKGVTFDSGGYIIKPENGMGDMKTDMAGAGCVLATMQAIAKKQLKINAIGILCLAENMISGRAFKPGDVAVAFNGKTVELIDTDCEGRLVLADGVAYAKHLGATRIVDTATLTGAVTVVLGEEAASLYGNNDGWVEQVKAAGAEVGERLWALPNYPEYHKLIESTVADYINYSGRNAAAIAGGVFIAAFAEDVPFCHIDMANTSRAKSTSGYLIKGGSGFSTRTMITLAETLQS